MWSSLPNGLLRIVRFSTTTVRLKPRWAFFAGRRNQTPIPSWEATFRLADPFQARPLMCSTKIFAPFLFGWPVNSTWPGNLWDAATPAVATLLPNDFCQIPFRLFREHGCIAPATKPDSEATAPLSFWDAATGR